MKPYDLKVSSAYLLSGLSGILFVLIFPPFNFHLLAWICLVPLLIAISGRPHREAFKYGLCCGVMYFGGVMPWLMNVLSVYGHIPNWLSFALMMLLVVVLALYIGLFALGIGLIGDSTDRALLAPFIFVAVEYMRGHVLSGLPWALLAHSQHQVPAVIQVASVTGVYGVTFVIVLVNSAIAHYVLKPGDTRLSSRLLAGALLIAFLNTAWGQWKIDEVKSMGGQQFKAAVIQGNIDQGIKWDRKYKAETLSKYLRLTREAAADKPDLIVWPETAVPFFYGRDKVPTEQVRALVRESGVPLLFGGLGIEKSDSPGGYDYMNRAFVVMPDRRERHYDKQHLVPFGEYVPFRRLLFFVDKITDAVRGDITPGVDTIPITVNGQAVGIQICYEIIFSEPSRAFARNGASIIVNITNDAWFGNTSASAQHMMSLPFRAVENRLPIIRAANTGISGFVSAIGEIKITTPLFETVLVSEELTVPAVRDTFYKRFGDVFAWLCFAVSAVGLFVSIKRGAMPSV